MRHLLKRTGTIPRADRRIRPWTVYDCTCGEAMLGGSRRQAKAAHHEHHRTTREQVSR